jgi:hypothetical protein
MTPTARCSRRTSGSGLLSGFTRGADLLKSRNQTCQRMARKKKRRRDRAAGADRRTRAVDAMARDGVPLEAPERLVALQPVRADDGQLVYFPAPFVWTLNLDLARRLRDRGERARRQAWRGPLSPIEVPERGPAKAADNEKAANDALAYISAAVFLAFEAFANEMIERLPPGTTVKVGSKEVERDDMPRELSIEDKLKRAVPLATSRRVAGDSRLWGKFSALKQLRDELVHLKERGYSPDPDAPSPYSRLMRGDASGCVDDAVELIGAMEGTAGDGGDGGATVGPPDPPK